MKAAIVGVLATVAQAQYFYPQARVVAPQVARAPVVAPAPVRRVVTAAPPVEVEEVEAPAPRYWRYEFDQAQYNLDHIEPKVSTATIELLNQIRPNSIPNAGRFSSILGYEAYQTNVDKYEQAWEFERSKGVNADRSKLRNYDLGRESAQLRADRNLVNVLNLGGNNQISNLLSLQRRGVDTERAEYNFLDAERKYRAGEIDRWELEEYRRELDWKEDKERNNLISISGNTQLSQFATYSNYNVNKEQSDYLWDAVDDAEYEFRSNPSRETSRALRLAELEAEASENKASSSLAGILGNPLLAIISDLRENELEEELYELEDEWLHRDYYNRGGYGRNFRGPYFN